MRPVFSDPKTEQSRRSIRLTKAAVNALERQRELVVTLQREATVANWRPVDGEDLVFPSAAGTPLINSNVTNRFKAILERLNLPRQRFHDLRHATASLLLAEGVDIFTVKEILGYSQIALTANTYGHLTDKVAHEAADRLHRALSDTTDDILTTKVTTDAIASDGTRGEGSDKKSLKGRGRRDDID